MGWYGCTSWNMSDAIKECCEGWEDGDSKVTCITHKLVGMSLWAVKEQTVKGVAQRYIALYLMKRERGGGWMYKPLDESMGPGEASCPLSYLDMVPMPDDPHGWCTKWRESVRQWHAKHNPKWKVGQALRNWNGDIYYVHQLRPFLVTTNPRNGYIYKAKKSQFTAVDEEVLPKEA